jgi:hypothetical protein
VFFPEQVVTHYFLKILAPFQGAGYRGHARPGFATTGYSALTLSGFGFRDFQLID